MREDVAEGLDIGGEGGPGNRRLFAPAARCKVAV